MHTKRSELCNYADISRAHVFGLDCAPFATRPHAHMFLWLEQLPTPLNRVRVFLGCGCADEPRMRARFCRSSTRPNERTMIRIVHSACAHVLCSNRSTMPIIHSRACVFASEQFATARSGHTKAPPARVPLGGSPTLGGASVFSLSAHSDTAAASWPVSAVLGSWLAMSAEPPVMASASACWALMAACRSETPLT